MDKKSLRFFHMKDFEYALSALKRGARDQIGRKNHFKDLNESEFLPLLKRMHGVINRKRKDGSYRLVEFASSVVKTDFDNARPAELKDDPECKSYYIYNIANIMKMIALWCSEKVIYDPIHYIFAGGDKEGGNIENWFDYCWKDEQSKNYFRLSKGYTRMGYDIKWMEGEPALQAADIAAFEFNKAAQEIAQRGNVDIPLDELRKSLPSLGRAPHFSFTLTRENLPESFAQIIRYRRSKGTL